MLPFINILSNNSWTQFQKAWRYKISDRPGPGSWSVVGRSRSNPWAWCVMPGSGDMTNMSPPDIGACLTFGKKHLGMFTFTLDPRPKSKRKMLVTLNVHLQDNTKSVGFLETFRKPALSAPGSSDPSIRVRTEEWGASRWSEERPECCQLCWLRDDEESWPGRRHGDTAGGVTTQGTSHQRHAHNPTPPGHRSASQGSMITYLIHPSAWILSFCISFGIRF